MNMNFLDQHKRKIDKSVRGIEDKNDIAVRNMKKMNSHFKVISKDLDEINLMANEIRQLNNKK